MQEQSRDSWLSDFDCDVTFRSREQASKSMATSLVVDPLTVSVVDVIGKSPMASLNLIRPPNWGGIKLSSVKAEPRPAASGPIFKTLDGQQPSTKSHLACDPLFPAIAVASGHVHDSSVHEQDDEKWTAFSSLVDKFEDLVSQLETCETCSRLDS
jgi:hypothetical protein